jgi:hypothetical protein
MVHTIKFNREELKNLLDDILKTLKYIKILSDEDNIRFKKIMKKIENDNNNDIINNVVDFYTGMSEALKHKRTKSVTLSKSKDFEINYDLFVNLESIKELLSK